MTDAQFSEFRQLIAQEQFSEALAIPKDVLAANPNNADALGARAVARVSFKRPQLYVRSQSGH